MDVGTIVLTLHMTPHGFDPQRRIRTIHHLLATSPPPRQTERQKKAKKKRVEDLQGKDAPQPLFPAIQLLHDAQGLAEKLFRNLRTCNEGFEVRNLGSTI